MTRLALQPCRRGLSLLEVTLTIGLMALVMGPVLGLLHVSHRTWEAHDSQQQRLHGAHALLRHLAENLRQAEAVKAISDATDSHGALTARMADGSSYVWAWRKGDVLFGVGKASSLAAAEITGLSFVGYEEDAVTRTTDPARVRCVRCTVATARDRPAGSEDTSSCFVWLRP